MNGENHNPYTMKAKRCEYNGNWYDSKLEMRVAQLLDKNGIKFELHKNYLCFWRDGTPFNYKVDFVFEQPIRPLGIHKYITVLEVKGVLYREALDRLDGLEYCHRIRGYICTPSLVEMWENSGFF